MTVTTTLAISVMASPVGPLRLVYDGRGLAEAHYVDSSAVSSDDGDEQPVLAEARRQFELYFAGELREFDLPLSAHGTAFQRRVWAELAEVPYAETVSYGEIARRLGLPPGASRAVGSANGANPLAIIVPCHRVIGAGGKLTGYAGGLERKRALLELEARAVGRSLLF